MKVGIFKSPSAAGQPRPGHSSIRGKVISGPIPIPNPADDDEFSMRQSGVRLATPLGNEGINLPTMLEDSSPSASGIRGDAGPVPEVAPGSTVEPKPNNGRTETSASPAQRRTDRSSTLRYSTVSTGTDTDTSRRSGPQRKKSTLRTTLGKIFGRKKKNGSNEGLETHPENPTDNVQHRSDPSALARQVTKEGEPKRSASLPVTEFDRALRSHSVGADDIIAIESAHNSMTGGETILYRRRAATTTSRLLTRRSGEFGDLAGLSPRPISHARAASHDALTHECPENIGRAITSDILMMHRRSRSLSQLDGVADGLTSRNRSDEIRYWRESYQPAGPQSPSSSNVVDNNESGNATSIPEPSANMTPRTPPQPFNFGQIVGMKITQAAGLEERIESLEVQNQKLEKLVSQLFEVVTGVRQYSEHSEPQVFTQTHVHPSAPSTAQTSMTVANPGLYQTTTNQTSSSRYSTSRQSNESFGDGHTFIGSIPQSAGPMHRPVSTATIRGSTSLPALPRDAPEPFNADHYTSLLAMIETERAARQVLEEQVKRLNNKLSLLSRAQMKSEALAKPAYSVFEQDDEDETPAMSSEENPSDSEAFRTPREEHPAYEFGAFGEELAAEDPSGPRKKAARTLSLSRLTLGKPPKPTPEVEL